MAALLSCSAHATLVALVDAITGEKWQVGNLRVDPNGEIASKA